MLVKDDVTIILEALAYYAERVLGERNRARVWKVYFEVRDDFEIDSPRRKSTKKIKRILMMSAAVAGILAGYLLRKISG